MKLPIFVVMFAVACGDGRVSNGRHSAPNGGGEREEVASSEESRCHPLSPCVEFDPDWGLGDPADSVGEEGPEEPSEEPSGEPSEETPYCICHQSAAEPEKTFCFRNERSTADHVAHGDPVGVCD
jgi:hypothetical protein